jgi:hypothetical protein
MDIWETTNESVQAAKREGLLTDKDEGAVAVLLQLAERLDDPDFPVIDGRFDNVTQSIYFRACEQLGLTPAGRSRLADKKESGNGKLAQLRSIEGGRSKRRTAGR